MRSGFKKVLFLLVVMITTVLFAVAISLVATKPYLSAQVQKKQVKFSHGELTKKESVRQLSSEEQACVEAYNQHNLIRFHVIANSDSDRDQALKRKVRDLIVERMTPEFKKAHNIQEARKIATSHMGDMKEIALKEIKAWGENYPVKVQLGNFDFPVKSYGDLTLPAGNYEAVRVVIGQGQGANWWCVLFPPLCFGDVSRAMAPIDVTAQKSVVSNNVYNQKDYTEPVVRVRYKLLELLGWY